MGILTYSFSFNFLYIIVINLGFRKKKGNFFSFFPFFFGKHISFMLCIYHRYEFELVNDVLLKLDHRYPNELKRLIGVDENCKSIELLLEQVPIIRI